MRALPVRSIQWLAVIGMAFAGLGCGEEVPPGARPLSEAERASGEAASPPAARPPSDVPAPSPAGGPMAGATGSGAPAPAPANAPRVASVDPPNGATGVDPSRTTLSVTFDREMDREGWAWVVEDEATAPEIGEARFDGSGRTNTVHVELEPGREYVVWVNSRSHQYFKGLDGTPSVPYRWTFRTAGEGTGADAGSGGEGRVPLMSSRADAAPRVVNLDPPNGDTGVDPSRSTISVTFDKPMEGSWAWVTEGGTTPPETVGDPTFTADRKTNHLPVRLQPNTTYTIWVNSDQYQLFRSVDGVPSEPVRWTFTTGPGDSGG